ncbi:hypothetical protein CANCADRAFT_43570 [Tortispora caseinolytica NRRL Y-17796]|uniref:Uncharacterized protein n=1 Tax=Tortispora caseinolytica NRRL Y-17796 TaxID=767744 RepID=A0A1E4TDT0_9ASCO|nr:hypothetical protein CANCADRAFT_43570 [Tortispora caseinolytica NRRL Y-17796]
MAPKERSPLDILALKSSALKSKLQQRQNNAESYGGRGSPMRLSTVSTASLESRSTRRTSLESSVSSVSTLLRDDTIPLYHENESEPSNLSTQLDAFQFPPPRTSIESTRTATTPMLDAPLQVPSTSVMNSHSRSSSFQSASNVNFSRPLSRQITPDALTHSRENSLDPPPDDSRRFPKRSSSLFAGTDNPGFVDDHADNDYAHRSSSLSPPPRRLHVSKQPSLSELTKLELSNIGSSHTRLELSSSDYVKAGTNLFDRGDMRDAAYHFRCAAERSSVAGSVLYGLCLQNGWGVKKDKNEAFKWVQTAVKLCETGADGYEQGISAPRFVQKTAGAKPRTYKTLALSELANMYRNGWGCKTDEEAAMKILIQSGSEGDAQSYAQAADICAVSTPRRKKDLKRAARLYRLAESMGHKTVGTSWIYKEKYMDGKGEHKHGKFFRF